MINSFVLEAINDVAKESYEEGRIAKSAAEKISGLIFPDPVWMQHSSYRVIRDLWKDRKSYLKLNIDMKLGLVTSLENEAKKKENLDQAEATRLLEEKRLRRLEIKRQKRLCAEMDAEYLLCKEFYRWEYALNLRERRLMKKEDEEMKAYLKEKARLEELAKSSYNVSGGNLEDEQKANMVTDYDTRRKQLKELAIERRRAAEELEIMIEEDKRSKMLQDLDRLERQKAAYIAVFGEDDDSDLGNQIPSYTIAEDGSVIVPHWMIVPDNWMNMTIEQQKKFVRLMSLRQKLAMDVLKNIEKDRKKTEILQKKSKKEWKKLLQIAEISAWKSELDYMNTEEEAKEIEFNIKEIGENLRKLTLFCRTKGEEELRARTTLKQKEELARKRTKELEDAKQWLDVCLKRSKTRDKMKRRVTNDCKFVDTDSITGHFQRFRTEDLRDRLYWMYFNKVVLAIINRAEIIASERQTMKIQENLSSNKANLIERTIALKFVWKDIQRDELMRMRRSELTVKFFPRERKATLRQRFGSWVRFFYWNRGHREAFTMKYDMLLRQGRLQRQFKQQLETKPESNSPKQHYQASTIMQMHRERTVQCKRCIQFYLESQNNSFSCSFHPGIFTFCCPKYCKNPGLTMKCVAHKRKRWTCCDSSHENIQGCSRRYHCPKDVDPIYESLMQRLDERDAELIEGLDSRLEQAKADDWILKEQMVKREQLRFIEGQIESDREKARAYDKLKFV